MQGRIAIITGASRGVGKELAETLAQRGCFVILLARDTKALEQVCRKIHSGGGKGIFFTVDVSNSIAVESCIGNIINQYGRIDLLINNAAILKRGTTTLPDDEIEELLKINLNGAIFVAKYVAAQMKKQRDGYIINISSLGGKVSASFAGIYAASKFGLSGFSEALTKEMSLYGVKVTNICPSMIATEMAKGRKFTLDQMIQLSDIIKTVEYLLSLSKNAIPTEILISCLPLIEKTTESLYKIYLD
jgi:3-oxoacyl-[acyl-carrier protein] reductase